METEILIGCRNLHTPHSAESYPGVLVVRPGDGWVYAVMVPKPGDSFVAQGGEFTYAYETASGVRATGFQLRAGDRATVLRHGLPAFLAEWRIERAGG